jgi:hypothetical protein
MAQENPLSALKPIDRISARVRAIGLGGRSTWAVLRNLLSLPPGAGYNHYGVNPHQDAVFCRSKPMATVRERPRSTSAVRHEQVVETQLNKALSRIRGLDLTTGFLSFLALTLGFSLVMALIDRWLSLPLLARQIALLGYGATVVTFLAFFVGRPLLRQINPYYAARQVEKTLPSAKNSVVNWLDLRNEPISPAILGAVGQRAAHDLAQTDLEQAISGKRAAWLGSITGILVVAQFIALIFWGFPTFSSLWGRTFAPFNNFGITSKTRIEVKTKDVTIPVDHAVTISVAVAGKVPDPAKADALRLHIRYRQGDPYEEPIGTRLVYNRGRDAGPERVLVQGQRRRFRDG